MYVIEFLFALEEDNWNLEICLGKMFSRSVIFQGPKVFLDRAILTTTRTIGKTAACSKRRRNRPAGVIDCCAGGPSHANWPWWWGRKLSNLS